MKKAAVDRIVGGKIAALPVCDDQQKHHRLRDLRRCLFRFGRIRGLLYTPTAYSTCDFYF